MNADTVPGYIRTYVPIVLAWGFGWLATLGVVVDAGAQSALASGIGAVVAAAYYAAVRWAEKRWPWVGKFLGSAKQPSYDGDVKPLRDMQPADMQPARELTEDPDGTPR